MALFLVFTTAPLNKLPEVRDTFLKVVETSPPPYLRSRGVYMSYGSEGAKWYNIVEIDDNHIVEGTRELLKRMIPFHRIEGLKIIWEPIMSVRDVIEIEREASEQ